MIMQKLRGLGQKYTLGKAGRDGGKRDGQIRDSGARLDRRAGGSRPARPDPGRDDSGDGGGLRRWGGAVAGEGAVDGSVAAHAMERSGAGLGRMGLGRARPGLFGLAMWARGAGESCRDMWRRRGQVGHVRPGGLRRATRVGGS